MLRALPLSLFSWNFRIYDGDTPVAVIERSWFKETGHLILEEAAYSISREKPFTGHFVLEQDTTVVASADKPSVFTRKFIIEHAGRHFVLKPEGLMSRRFVLLEDGRRVGSVRPERPFSRKAQVHLPEALPLAFRIFVLWLVLLLWKRSADHAS